MCQSYDICSLLVLEADMEVQHLSGGELYNARANCNLTPQQSRSQLMHINIPVQASRKAAGNCTERGLKGRARICSSSTRKPPAAAACSFNCVLAYHILDGPLTSCCAMCLWIAFARTSRACKHFMSVTDCWSSNSSMHGNSVHQHLMTKAK